VPKPVFIRARMIATGSEFDTTPDSIWIRKGLAVRVKPRLYPPSSRCRAPKHRPRGFMLTAPSAVDPNNTKEG